MPAGATANRVALFRRSNQKGREERWNTGEEQIEEIRQKKRREINREKASKEGEPAIMNR